MTQNASDFKRPEGVPNGILVNTNTDALQVYKRTKSKLAKVNSLENQVSHLTRQLEELRKLVHDRILNTD
jgi:hypothetical protein